MSYSARYPGEPSAVDNNHDNDDGLDLSELPNEYRVRLNSFLRNACNDGHETLVRVLLDKGADVNYITTNTQLPTALHVTIASTKESILPLILPQASNATIQAALQFAIQYQSKLLSIIRILQQDSSSVSNNGDSKDKDKDANQVEKAPKDSPAQKESETQTSNPPLKETQTQTNGEDHSGNTRTNEPQHTLAKDAHKGEETLATSDSEKVDTGTDDKHQEIKQRQQEQQAQQERLHRQLQEQQKLLQEQQLKIQEQQIQNEQAQKKADQAQQASVKAQGLVEEMKTQLHGQDEQIVNQTKEVHKLSEQLTVQQSLTHKLTEQLSAQESHTQKLSEQLTVQEGQVNKLNTEVTAGQVLIEQLQKRISELESEKQELEVVFRDFSYKSDAIIKDFQLRVDALQSDIDTKSTRIESISKERDHERRAKEVAKRFALSSNLSDEPTLGHSHAIRMGSVQAPSPTPPDDEPGASKFNSVGRTRGNLINGAREGGDKKDSGGIRRSKTNLDMTPLIPPGRPLSSKSRSKDDMDIASEADRARVRRLVERWEEMKFLELTAKQE